MPGKALGEAPKGGVIPGKAPAPLPGAEPGFIPIIEFMRLDNMVESVAVSSFFGAGHIHW